MRQNPKNLIKVIRKTVQEEESRKAMQKGSRNNKRYQFVPMFASDLDVLKSSSVVASALKKCRLAPDLQDMFEKKDDKVKRVMQTWFLLALLV